MSSEYTKRIMIDWIEKAMVPKRAKSRRQRKYQLGPVDLDGGPKELSVLRVPVVVVRPEEPCACSCVDGCSCVCYHCVRGAHYEALRG